MSMRLLLHGIAVVLIVTSQAAAHAAGTHAYPATGSIELAFTP